MPDARYDVRSAFRLGAVLTLVIAALALVFDNPASPLFWDWRPSGWMDPLHPWLMVITAVLVGMGAGSQVVLFWANRHRLRAVLRPNVGRVICGIVLALLCPFAHFAGSPVTPLWGLAAFLGSTFGMVQYTSMEWVVLLPFLVAFPFGYFFSSLMISGVRSRWVRIALFGQFWLMTYGAVLLVFGYSGFSL